MIGAPSAAAVSICAGSDAMNSDNPDAGRPQRCDLRKKLGALARGIKPAFGW